VKRIEIHVERLVVDGSLQGREKAIRAAVERELARLAGEPGGPLAAPGRSTPREAARRVGARLETALARPKP